MPIRWNEEQAVSRVRQALTFALAKATETLRNEEIRRIRNTSKSGRVYYRRGVSHRASAPGEAPASDTGFLVASIRTRYNLEALVGAVIVSAEYAPYLEYGTLRMDPRPFVRPTVEMMRGPIRQMFADEVAKALA